MFYNKYLLFMESLPYVLWVQVNMTIFYFAKVKHLVVKRLK